MIIIKMANSIFTIGHSNHPITHFLELLKKNEITAVADVRSQPYSRYNPQFNRESFEIYLKSNGISYVFLGTELGARSKDPSCYIEGKVQYDKLAQTDLFQEGIQRVIKGSETHRIALLCSEKDPLMCHRTILVGKKLVELGVNLKHILSDGKAEEHQDTLNHLLEQLKLPYETFFKKHEDILLEAYALQAEKIAYVDNGHPGKHTLEPGQHL